MSDARERLMRELVEARYGHVEIASDRSLRTRLRSFLARLADSVRGRK